MTVVEEEFYSKLFTDALYGLLPEGAGELLYEVPRVADSPILTVNGFTKWISRLMLSAFSQALGGFGTVLSVILLCSLLKKYCEATELTGVSQTAQTVLSVTVILSLLPQISQDCSIVTEFFMWARAFFTGAIPVMTALYAMGGNVAVATVSASAMTVILSLSELMSTKMILPCAKLCFGLGVAGALTGEQEFSPISSFFSSLASKLLVFFMTLISSGFLFKGILASSADSLGIRGLKFAASAFIPIVGAAVGEATGTVASALSLLRGSFGTFAAVALAIAFLPLLLSLAFRRIALSLCSALSNFLGLGDLGVLCNRLCGVYALFLCAAVTVSLCLFLFCAIFAVTACVY